MGFLRKLFSSKDPEKLISELIKIGKNEKFISRSDDVKYNDKMEHKRAREIGERLDEIGGIELMRMAHQRVIKEVHYPGAARELEYCWNKIGNWRA